jgi:hypothetical protein
VSEVFTQKIERTCIKTVGRSAAGQMKKRKGKGQYVGKDGC